MRLPAAVVIALVLSVLAGCASAPGVSTGGAPRCDRNGDEENRRRC